MKHVGKMKNNGAKIVVAYRTIPGDPHSALVIGTGNLGDSYHDSLMTLVQAPDGQQTGELGDLLGVRRFPDGSNMLQWFHSRGHLKKVPTTGVIMTPAPQSSIQLDELNKLIAEQKGVALEDLAINDGSQKKKDDPTKTTSASVNAEAEEVIVPVTAEVITEELTPTQMRSKADALFKQAQTLRKQADAVDPPKKKAVKEKVEA